MVTWLIIHRPAVQTQVHVVKLRLTEYSVCWFSAVVVIIVELLESKSWVLSTRVEVRRECMGESRDPAWTQ